MHIVYAHPYADYQPPRCVLVLPIWLHPAVIDDMRTEPEPLPPGAPPPPPKPRENLTVDLAYAWLKEHGPTDKYKLARVIGKANQTVDNTLRAHPHLFTQRGKMDKKGHRRTVLWGIVE